MSAKLPLLLRAADVWGRQSSSNAAAAVAALRSAARMAQPLLQQRQHARRAAADTADTAADSMMPKSLLHDLFASIQRTSNPAFEFETHQVSSATSMQPNVFEARLRCPPTATTAPINGKEFVATGSSKKEAEHAAALQALEALAEAGALSGSLQYDVAAIGKLAEMRLGAESTEHLPPESHLRRIENALGYRFRNRDLLRQAFFHPSSGRWNNDRLALLGDRVLDLVVMQQALRLLPESGDDKLAIMKYKVQRITREACARYARALGLGPAIVMQVGFKTIDGQSEPVDSMLAECFEAVLGAMYQDAETDGEGLEIVKAYWEKHHPPEEAKGWPVPAGYASQ